MAEGEIGQDWRAFEAEVARAGDNVYLTAWWQCMVELEEFGCLTQGGMHMDIPPARKDESSAELLHVIGSYIDNCIMPLRKMYAWGVPTVAALEAIRSHAPPAGFSFRALPCLTSAFVQLQTSIRSSTRECQV